MHSSVNTKERECPESDSKIQTDMKNRMTLSPSKAYIPPTETGPLSIILEGREKKACLQD